MTDVLDKARAPFLAAYFPVGDPAIPLDMLSVYDECGVNIVEMGLKAEDPFADGEQVTSSMRRSRGSGAVADAAETAGAIRSFTRPALGILLCYPEPQVAKAREEWSQIDAVLSPPTDAPAQSRIKAEARARDTKLAEFVPYDFDDEDIVRARRADAYVMVQYTRGKTGLRQDLDSSLADRIARLRAGGVGVPILAGIGISAPDQVRDALNQGADGIVTGSMVIAMAQQGAGALRGYLTELRDVLDHG